MEIKKQCEFVVFLCRFLQFAERGVILLWELGPGSIIFNRFDSKSQFWVEFTLKATKQATHKVRIDGREEPIKRYNFKISITEQFLLKKSYGNRLRLYIVMKYSDFIVPLK